jgi:ATP-dependent helicase/nuclease subunit B
MPSKLLQKIRHIADENSLKNFKSKEQYLQFVKYNLNLASPQIAAKPFIVNCKHFPRSISATSIETLIRNPYAFYARNILRLYPIKELTLDSMSAEFGTLLHKIIALYNSNHQQSFLSIAEKEFNDAGVDEYVRKLWWPKICVLAEEYTKFSLARGEKLQNVYSEIAGKMQLEYGEKKVQITAIADEILVTKEGAVEILDYKTGAPPSASDVLSGLSPQLILEAMIVRHNGFPHITKTQTDKLAFIKISSSEPFLSQIILPDFNIDQHLNALQKLLAYYVTCDVYYPIMPNKPHIPKYNDYKHLGRK